MSRNAAASPKQIADTRAPHSWLPSTPPRRAATSPSKLPKGRASSTIRCCAVSRTHERKRSATSWLRFLKPVQKGGTSWIGVRAMAAPARLEVWRLTDRAADCRKNELFVSGVSCFGFLSVNVREKRLHKRLVFDQLPPVVGGVGGRQKHHD